MNSECIVCDDLTRELEETKARLAEVEALCNDPFLWANAYRAREQVRAIVRGEGDRG